MAGLPLTGTQALFLGVVALLLLAGGGVALILRRRRLAGSEAD
ncbi:LPXTG cell wall anchor domain-containing protein [Actinomyces naeslundii]|uniref:Gram positive anchor n=1 Tax=Actinomyces naeslundii (strain ATCC 12104 / DSM 43013 / CCUG 2238 / JCM 8349 / NCTC 10301 / Howell 279) TaxID=1115803 RepID=J3ABD6_ACTNH|nr:LPXTG cell wall anchor domain-containing protein [Actinomyces naeslundii]EJN85058.1 gram positive anchor [Actinomyces naeslundii str. Howell 279]